MLPFEGYAQFILCELVPKPGTTKKDKEPLNPHTLRPASALDPANWMDRATAQAMVTMLGYPYLLGFAITKACPFWFLDIDDCMQADGQWSPVARQLLEVFAGAAVEISASGTGLHIFGSGTAPAHSCKNSAYHLEFYTEGRFVALTGNGAMGDASLDFSHLLPWLVSSYFPPRAEADTSAGWTDGPCAGWAGPPSDTDLLAVALKSAGPAAVMSGKATFRDLWEANPEALNRSYPDNFGQGRSWDGSQADAALAQHLAFWTGNDCERIARLMNLSALKREKWEREKYFQDTITRACGLQTKWATGWAPAIGLDETPAHMIPPPMTDGDAMRSMGIQFMPVDGQAEHFKGCIYVCDAHGVLIPGGNILKPDQFKVMYGGYTFPLDNLNEKVTRNAWECFTESQAIKFPKVETSCFYPNLPFGAIVDERGKQAVNLYTPQMVRRVKGDPSRFLQHLAKLLPDPEDQLKLLCFLAALVQYPGVKFRWCPLLIGCEGNGKTFLSECAAYAVGMRYTHTPKAKELDSKFNDYLYGNLLVCVEDVYVPENRLDLINSLRPMITGGVGGYLEIEPKGGKKETRRICCNFILNSNHLDAIRKTDGDRRFCIFRCAQQALTARADKAAAGLTGDYFAELYKWAMADGFAIITDFLASYEIPDALNPATLCQEAPITSTTAQAISENRGSIEQEIVEAIEQQLPGFSGGWVSSIALENLLLRLNAARRISHSKRLEMLAGLGYLLHPRLIDGRVNNAVMPDAGKPKLFVKAGHPSLLLATPAEVARAYTASQAPGASPGLVAIDGPVSKA